MTEPTSAGGDLDGGLDGQPGPMADTFGLLPNPRAITFDRGAAEPLPTLSSEIARVRHDLTHRDGHRYPPLIHDRALHVFEPMGGQTERPAHLHKMPPPHVLRLDPPLAETSAPFRLGDGAFLIQFIGLMFGYRLQFDTWWFDGRLPMFRRRWRLPIAEDRESKLLSDAYKPVHHRKRSFRRRHAPECAGVIRNAHELPRHSLRSPVPASGPAGITD
jgi:hypothetical protein